MTIAPPPPLHLQDYTNPESPHYDPPTFMAHTLLAPPPPPHLMHLCHAPQLIEQAVDTECYPNYWLIKFYNPALPGVSTREFALYHGHPLDIAGVRAEMARSTNITFNGMHYDYPMIALALAGADNRTLKEANDLIIRGGLKSWDFYKHYNLEPLPYDHIDVKETAPGVNVSLKTYGGRGHSRKLQDLPIKPDTFVTPEQMAQLSLYCTNDLITTWELYRKLEKAIALRVRMSAKYGVDLRSKSDAQIAEAIFKQTLGFKPNKAHWPHMTPFKYEAPGFIQFGTPHLQGILRDILAMTFHTSDKDQVSEEVDEFGNKVKTGVIMPAELKKLVITIGGSSYKLGIGGLHSMESARYHISNAIAKLSDHDVNSYYPSLILLCGMFPAQLGERFLEIYREVYEERLHAKREAARLQKRLVLLEKELSDAKAAAKISQEK